MNILIGTNGVGKSTILNKIVKGLTAGGGEFPSHLFDTVVSPMLSKVCNLLRQERQNEIYHAAAHRTQKRNEMSCYENSLQDIKVMLKKNTGYMVSEQFRRLQEDIRRYLSPLE